MLLLAEELRALVTLQKLDNLPSADSIDYGKILHWMTGSRLGRHPLEPDDLADSLSELTSRSETKGISFRRQR